MDKQIDDSEKDREKMVAPEDVTYSKNDAREEQKQIVHKIEQNVNDDGGQDGTRPNQEDETYLDKK